MKNGYPRWSLAAVAALSAGCASLPAAGPDTAAMLRASVAQAEAPASFTLIDADAATIDALARVRADTPVTTPFAGLGPYAPQLASGDLVEVALFEATGGGLFGGSSEGGAASRGLLVQTITSDGSIRIPYAGDVRVAGLSTSQAAQRIEAALHGQAIAPQAVVAVRESPTAAVTVLGDAVQGGGRVPLRSGGERMLDVVAAAGGFSQPLHESVVRLTRDGVTAIIDAETALRDPAQNVAMRPQDVIAVEHRPRYYSVLGAVGESAQIPFGKSGLTLDEALSKARGLLDTRADPAGVFVLRAESATTMQSLRPAEASVDPTARPQPVPTAYRFDFSEPATLIAAKGFVMRPGDLIYVANAETIPTEKVLTLLGLILPALNTGLLIGTVN